MVVGNLGFLSDFGCCVFVFYLLYLELDVVGFGDVFIVVCGVYGVFLDFRVDLL